MTPSAFLEAMERACAEAQVQHAKHRTLGWAEFTRGVYRALGLREQDATWPAIAERLADLAAEARRNEDRAREVRS
jgi:hypothetical protein